MLNIEEEGAGRAATPEGPARTTFTDGRMTAKEAWNYCRTLCVAAEVEAPTLRTFKWHLKHGNVIEAEMVRNPFGVANTEKVCAITAEAVRKFVVELTVRGDELRLVGRPKSETGQPPPPLSTVSAEPKSASKVATPSVEFDNKSALRFLRAKVGRGCELNLTTLGFYLAYDIISSRFEGRQRMVRQEDLEAYLDLVPDAVYANHISYETEKDPQGNDLSMRDAYAYYSDVDPSPITLNSFRSLVAAGIIRPIRTADSPKAPVLGFRRQEIAAFLALRQRILEKNAETTATKSFLTRKAAEQAKETPTNPVVAQLIEEALERAQPALEAAKRKLEEKKAPDIPESRDLTVAPLPVSGVPPSTPNPKRVTVKEAYAHYRNKCENPFTISWFRSKVAQGLSFDVICVEDVRPLNPQGKKYLITLESIDEYLTANPGRPAPEYLPVETAYHKLVDSIPPGVSLLQFKRLVKKGSIKATTRGGVVKVGMKAVLEHFKKPTVSTGRPVAPARTTKPSLSDVVDRVHTRPEPETGNEVRVTVSIGDYSGPEELQEAIEMLARQGLKVDVRP